MAKNMLQGSRVKGIHHYRDERNADGGSRHLRHANRYAENRLWKAEADKELAEAREAADPGSPA
ncbi:hypothetical protein ACFOWE_18020 [Planomonospora corallina]|uniref:Uncharacterized protein n=1 Tax=Planomonospora corallina TaxID=1806052 RepID=A0ABV8IB01_9ACTN